MYSIQPTHPSHLPPPPSPASLTLNLPSENQQQKFLIVCNFTKKTLLISIEKHKILSTKLEKRRAICSLIENGTTQINEHTASTWYRSTYCYNAKTPYKYLLHCLNTQLKKRQPY